MTQILKIMIRDEIKRCYSKILSDFFSYPLHIILLFLYHFKKIIAREINVDPDQISLQVGMINVSRSVICSAHFLSEIVGPNFRSDCRWKRRIGDFCAILVIMTFEWTFFLTVSFSCQCRATFFTEKFFKLIIFSF